MKIIDVFLKALENVMGNHRGFYVPQYTVTPTKVPAIKEFLLQVWCVDGEYKTLLSTVKRVEHCTEKWEMDVLEERVQRESIENILKYYGL